MLLQLTTKCNEGCTHCMVNAKPCGEDMSLETLENAIRYIRSSKPNILVITGGEITLHNQWYEFITKILTETNVWVVLESNGSFIDNKMDVAKMKILLGMNKVLTMQLSSHEEYYPNYEKFMSNRTKFEKLGDKVEVRVNWQGKLSNIHKLGRFKTLNPDYVPKGNTQCSPIVSRIVAMYNELKTGTSNKLTSFLNLLENHGYMCKPSISTDGGIHVGETQYCHQFDNVAKYDNKSNHQKLMDESILNLLRFDFETCNKCECVQNIPR